jgi:hypothetical protein
MGELTDSDTEFEFLSFSLLPIYMLPAKNCGVSRSIWQPVPVFIAVLQGRFCKFVVEAFGRTSLMSGFYTDRALLPSLQRKNAKH